MLGHNSYHQMFSVLLICYSKPTTAMIVLVQRDYIQSQLSFNILVYPSRTLTYYVIRHYQDPCKGHIHIFIYSVICTPISFFLNLLSFHLTSLFLLISLSLFSSFLICYTLSGSFSDFLPHMLKPRNGLNLGSRHTYWKHGETLVSYIFLSSSLWAHM